MPEAHNPTINRHEVHLPEQQAQPLPAHPSYRTKVPRAGAITPPCQVIKSCPGDVSLPRREGEMERQSRETPRLPKCDKISACNCFTAVVGSQKPPGKSQLFLLSSFATSLGSHRSDRRPGDDVSCSRSPPAMRFGRRGGG